MKTLTAEQVKKLPAGTDIRIVNNDTGKYSLAYIVKSGKRKMLKKPLMDPVVIVDRIGYHYERWGSMRVRVDFKKLTDTARIPTRATTGSAGYDLYVDTDKNSMVRPGETEWFGSGIAVEIPPGYVGLIYSRSGLSTKQGLRLANCVGVIDSDYRGEIGLPIHNDSDEIQLIRAHERVAQMILHQACEIDFIEQDNLSETDRGVGGFGSTGRM